MNRNNKILKICLLAVILISIAVTVIVVITSGVSDELSQLSNNWGFFRTYTVISNIVMGVVSAITLYFLAIKKGELPKWIYIFQLMGTSMVMLTFVTVILFLGPIRIINGKDVWFLFSKELFFLHFLNPVLAFISVALLPDKHIYLKKECFISVIPTIVYSFIYLYNVIISKTWYDFYGFTFGGKYYLIPFVIIIMYCAAFAVSVLIKKIHNIKIKD